MHDVITEAQYRKLIGKTAGKAFLFFGEEDYLKQHTVKLTREQISPDETFALFNDVTIDAIDYTPDALLGAMMPPPMMAEGKLILLRGLDFTSIKKEDLDPLIEALALLPEYDYNTVILQVPSGLITEEKKKTPTVFQRLCEVAIPVRFDPSTPAKLAAWCVRHFAHYGVQADGALCADLVAFVGRDMYRLAGEIQKLSYYVLAHERTTLCAADIQMVAVGAKETDTYALSNAVAARDQRAALEALDVMKFRRDPPLLILAGLAGTLCDIYTARAYMDAGRTREEIIPIVRNDYRATLMWRAAARTDAARITRAIELCAAADAKVKRSNSNKDYSAIEHLICAL